MLRKCAGPTGCASMRTIRTLILSLKCRQGRKQWLKEEEIWRNQENRRNQEEKRKISSWVHNSARWTGADTEQELFLNQNYEFLNYSGTGIIFEQLLFLNRNYLKTVIISEQELSLNIYYFWTGITV